MKKALRFIFISAMFLLAAQSAQAQIHFTAKLDGAQEVPPVTTAATATGAFTLNSTGTELSYHITFAGLSGALTNSHFHNGPAGVAAGVVRGITFTGNTASGVWKSSDATQPLTPTLVSELLAGRIYVNLHTAANPGGEIRGQVLVDYGIGLAAKLDGAQEVPPVTTTGTGTGSFKLKSSSSGTVTELEYHITFAGLSGSLTNSHFHNGPAGVAAGVVRNISFNGNTASGSWKSDDAMQPLTSALVTELLAGRIYVNLHTAANPGGEIRGQVLVTTGIGFTAKLDGAQEVPPVTTNAAGTGTFMLNNDGTELTYDVTVAGGFSGRINNAHFHNGPAGVAAGVVRNLNFLATGGTGIAANSAGVWKSTDASQPLTPTLVNELLNGNIYVNFHTTANSGGELRGQLKINYGISFSTKLTGLQEAPTPVISRATGTGVFTLADNGTELSYEITYANLSSSFAAAHFHNGPAGTAAGVVRAIDFSGKNTATGSWKSSDATQPLNSDRLLELLSGRLYVNIHSANFGGGEIRGQVVTDVNTLPLLTPIGVSRTLADTTFNVNLQGVVTTVDFQLGLTNTEYYFQDATGGLRVFIRGKLAIPTGTLIQVKNGFVYTINSRKNIEVQGNQVEILGTPGLPPPRLVTMTQYKANQASIEGQYIGLSRVSIKSGTWPATGSNSTIILRDTAGDSLAMFIDLDTDIDGSQPPAGTFDVVGVATQFNGVPQIQPSSRADFRPAGTVSVAETVAGLNPETFDLRQNYPNPFNPITTIEFVLGRTQPARLSVYDVLGHEVAVLFNRQAEAGKSYRLEFDGAKHSSGLYFYRLQSGERTQIRKMLLSK